jgi:hypothetical protein
MGIVEVLAVRTIEDGEKNLPADDAFCTARDTFFSFAACAATVETCARDQALGSS